MRLGIYMGLIAALVLLGVARPVARRLPPARAVWLLVGSSLAAATAWVWNLALVLGPYGGRIPVVARLGHWSAAVLAAHDPVPSFVAAVAAAWLAVALLGLLRAGRDGGREVVRLARLRRGIPRDRLAVVACPTPLAFTMPGWPGRVVVTTGMFAALESDERRVLLAHERAHLRYGHCGVRAAIRLAGALLPLVRPLVGDLDYALERWADEFAARAVGDRRLAARALARAALVSRSSPATPAAALGFGQGLGVAARVRALSGDPPSPRWWPILLPVGLALAGLLASVEAGSDTENLFELARRLLLAG